MSLGPPWGVTGFAHRIRNRRRNERRKKKMLVFANTINEIEGIKFMPSNLPIVFGNEIFFFNFTEKYCFY